MNDLVAIEKIAQWEKLKGLVLDSVSSPITKRVYNMALNEFMAWFQQAPRPGFTKATVSAWRVSLEERRLADQPRTLEELAEEFSVSRERIRQIETRAFERVQKAVRQRVATMQMPAMGSNAAPASWAAALSMS